MARNAWILDARPDALFRKGIAVAEAARFDFDSYLARTGLGDFALNHLQGTTAACDLYYSHLVHCCISSVDCAVLDAMAPGVDSGLGPQRMIVSAT